MAGPAWLDRLERRHSTPLCYTSVSLLAILDGAVLSGLAGRCVLPGLAVALGLLWLVAVHTDQRLVLTLPSGTASTLTERPACRLVPVRRASRSRYLLRACFASSSSICSNLSAAVVR